MFSEHELAPRDIIGEEGLRGAPSMCLDHSSGGVHGGVVVFCAHFTRPIISHTGERINSKQMVTHTYPTIGAKLSI